jgi:hypothetical protein
MPLTKLKIFISWSGSRSRIIGEALRDWLPDVLPLLDLFLSTEDVEKGAKWREILSGALQQSDLAIICLTPENLTSPWLLFEAGAVAKHDGSRVWTYLFGLEYTDVKDPLSEFQHTLANEADTRKLVQAINHRLGDGQLSHERLDRAFGTWWPQLADKLRGIPARDAASAVEKEPTKKILEMTTEILQRVRESSRPAVISADDVYDDDERVDMASVVSSMLFETLKLSGTPFKGIATCLDGAYAIHQEDKDWRVEKRIAEDLALGRLTLADMFAKSVQMKNPCKPNSSSPAAKR